MIAVQMELLEEARRSVSNRAFRRAVRLIRLGGRTLIYGIGLQAPLADYAEMRLTRFRRAARAITRTGEELAEELLAMEPGDVLIAMAYGPPTRDIDVLLQRARTLKIPVVLLTDVLAAALGERVAVALSARRSRADEWSTIGTSLVLIEALLFGLAAADSEAALAALTELGELRAQLQRRD
jgi:DNA-binding MurR/RpiR family transcriptional regulator